MTTSRVNGFLQALTYTNTSNTPPANLTFEVSFNDGDAVEPLTETVQSSINIAPIDDAPVQFAAGDLQITHAYNASHTLTAAELQVSDVDSPSSAITFSISNFSGVLDVRLNGLSTTSFTLADVEAGNVTVFSGNAIGSNMVVAMVITSSVGGPSNGAAFSIMATPAPPILTGFAAEDDTGTVGDHITSKQLGLTFSAGTGDPEGGLQSVAIFEIVGGQEVYLTDVGFDGNFTFDLDFTAGTHELFARTQYGDSTHITFTIAPETNSAQLSRRG